MSWLGAFPGASEPRASLSSPKVHNLAPPELVSTHSVQGFFRHHILSGVMFCQTLHLSPSVLNCVSCPVADLFQEGCFLLRRTTRGKNIGINQGQSHSSRQDKSNRLLFGLQVDTITAKVLCTEMAARETAEAVWELSECFNNFT